MLIRGSSGPREFESHLLRKYKYFVISFLDMDKIFNRRFVKIFSILLLIISGLGLATVVVVFFPYTSPFHAPLVTSFLSSLVLLFRINKNGTLVIVILITLALYGIIYSAYLGTTGFLGLVQEQKRGRKYTLETTIEWRDENCSLTAENIEYELYKGRNIPSVDLYICKDGSKRVYQGESLLEYTYPKKLD